MAADGCVNTSNVLPPSYPKVRWAGGRGQERGEGGGEAREGAR